MGFWNWFRARRDKGLDPRIVRAFLLVKRDIIALRDDLNQTNARLTQQNDTVSQNTRLINAHTARLGQLEEIVATSSISRQVRDNPVSKPKEQLSELVATKIQHREHPQGLHSLTEQEKRIMGVFLENRDMSLSYQDIAKSLGKSPHTVKNQMHQINMKTDLFDKTVDPQNRNRFKLKKHLISEAKLNAD